MLFCPTSRVRGENQNYLEDQARQGVNAPELSEHQSLQSTLHRGWYWGSEQFREYLLKKVDAAAIRRNRNYQSAQMGRDHGQAEAEKIVQQSLESFGLSESDLKIVAGQRSEKGGNCRLHLPKHDNPARLDGGAPADEKRSKCRSAT